MTDSKGFAVRSTRDQRHAWLSKDRLFLVVAGSFIFLILLTIIGYAIWGSGPELAPLPWFNPFSFIFLALASASLAFLIRGRYQVLNDPYSYWIGIGFATHSIGLTFYVLTWPGLLPEGRSFIAQSPNTAGFLVTLIPTLLVGFILLGLLSRPTGQWTQRKHSLLGSMATWCAGFALLFGLLVAFEANLPVMVLPDGSYSPILIAWNAVSIAGFVLCAFLALRRYQREGDALAAYIVFPLMALFFATAFAILGQNRYDVWWYLGRVVLIAGYLVVLFGLLSQYVQLFRQVRDSEARYRQLTESLPQLIWTCTPDGQCNYISPQWVAFTGISEQQQLGTGWLEQVHPEDLQYTIATWTEAVAVGRSLDMEFRLRRHDGIYCWFRSLALPVRNAAGEIWQWFGSCTDIDDRKKAEEALAAHALDLQRSNRDLQEFAYMASHDLQEPLRKIETFSSILLERLADDDENQRDLMTRMNRAANRMRSMVNGLLQLSRLETHAQPFQPVNLNQVAEEVLSDLELQLRRTNGTVELCELPVIEAEPEQIRRLFQNLIGNALKFQPSGGKARVNVCTEPAAPGYVQISVEDNGIGFDEEHARHLFEPFKRLVGRSEYEGSGIGLAICRKIVERHHGSITVRSQPGQGSIFIVTLPIHQHQGEQVTRSD